MKEKKRREKEERREGKKRERERERGGRGEEGRSIGPVLSKRKEGKEVRGK